ncbi:MAG: UDP-N-acetylglucosamine 2-epimerase (non-hydrolyzing) [Verrucomicrobiota bacterium]
MKVLTVIGTRPNFVKEALIHEEFSRKGIREIIVHTGQHYDFSMSQVFFEGLGIPTPDYHLNQKGKTPIKQTADIMQELEDILLAEKPDCTLVYGDVTSTLSGSIASAKLRIPVVHVEAGVRSQDLYNPEEINRRVTDALSALAFASTRRDYENLTCENFAADRICFSGDVVNDVLLKTVKDHKIRVCRGEYVLATIHRQENADSADRLHTIIEALVRCKKPVVFPVHPRTREGLRQNGLWDKLMCKKDLKVLEPQGYLEFVKLLAGADRVFTDSGGVRREGYVLGKPVIVPIGIVWFPEMVECGWMKVVDGCLEDMIDAIESFEPVSERSPIFGDGHAHTVIVRRIQEFFKE